MRLNKFLAQTGIGSRRKCDEFIKNRLIKINGKIVTDFSCKISEKDNIQYKNKYIEIEENKYYLILNKPKGYVCSSNDQFNRKIIFDLIEIKERMYSIGRLDYDTTGIIIITNDGDLCHFLSHPKFGFTKKYHVLTDKKLNTANINIISKGILINKNKMKGDFKFLTKTNKGFVWEIVLKEGKNHEIKKIFNHFSINVLELHRYEFANIKLGSLKEGKYRKLTKNEVNIIKKQEKIK